MANFIKNVVAMDMIARRGLYSINDSGKKFFDFTRLLPIPVDFAGDLSHWCVSHWGTDSYGWKLKVIDENTISFVTRWTAPHGIITALSRKYPDLEIEHWFSDECVNSYECGYRYCFGDEDWLSMATSADERLAIYRFCWGNNEKFSLRNGLWVCEEEE